MEGCLLFPLAFLRIFFTQLDCRSIHRVSNHFQSSQTISHHKQDDKNCRAVFSLVKKLKIFVGGCPSKGMMTLQFFRVNLFQFFRFKIAL